MSAFGVVRRIGLAWVRVYTSGLPDEERERRRGEVESDLYEHARSALVAGGVSIAGPVASRFARGVPADVTWRIAHELNTDDEHDLSASWHGRIALVLLLSIAVTSLVYACLHALGYIPGEPRYYAFVQVGLMVGTLVMLGGFSTSRRSPALGGLQILLPGLVMALMWGFMPPIALAILAITAYGVYRAARFWLESRQERKARPSRGTPA